MLIASVTAGAVLATATGPQAAQPTSHRPTDRTAAIQLADQDGFTTGELDQGKTLADGIAQLGISGDQFAKALDIALTHTIDTHGLRERLAALPASPTAQQTAEAAYPGDAEAQAAMLPVLANEKVRYTTLQNLAARSSEQTPASPSAGGTRPSSSSAAPRRSRAY
ncbi:hypothetical protein ADL21_00170 [Streptomyces albus subsp. albus]|nr:hypothetical protein ADL21_00170 [Streptomyces albus subsp. albus]